MGSAEAPLKYPAETSGKLDAVRHQILAAPARILRAFHQVHQGLLLSARFSDLHLLC
jgi:hypothetical protein